MRPEEIIRIERIQQSGQPIEAARTPADETFRNLLDRLQAEPASASEIGDADEFTRAVAGADEEFAAAMELRRMLEAAYRSKTG